MGGGSSRTASSGSAGPLQLTGEEAVKLEARRRELAEQLQRAEIGRRLALVSNFYEARWQPEQKFVAALVGLPASPTERISSTRGHAQGFLAHPPDQHFQHPPPSPALPYHLQIGLVRWHPAQRGRAFQIVDAGVRAEFNGERRTGTVQSPGDVLLPAFVAGPLAQSVSHSSLRRPESRGLVPFIQFEQV